MREMLENLSPAVNEKHAVWERHIQNESSVLINRPVIKGTRLTVDFVLRLFANGWTQKEIAASYPQLTPEIFYAIFAYASECVKETTVLLRR